MSSLARWIGLSLLVLSASLPAQTDRKVREIVIHSGWGGLGTPQRLTVTILGTSDGFQRDDKSVKPALVQALVAAAEAAPIVKPDPANLGIDQSWLRSQLALVEDRMPGKMPNATARQKALFESTFTNPEKISGVLPSLFTYSSFDDYPNVEVKIKFSDDSQLSLTSHSSYEFMLPWTIRGPNSGDTYNAEISRAISALLPPKGTNKERLVGPGFGFRLAEAVMNSIEKQWKEIGAEDRAGDSLAKFRSQYIITASDINPYHSAEYGLSWSPKGPHETNLHVTLSKPNFPPNLAVEGIFLSEGNRIQGVDEFLKTGSRYEDLTLSITWLMDWLRDHPDRHAYLFNVHGLSFGEHAMQTFAKDMKLRERDDLVEKVRAQQSQIALLKIDGADWLIFPDRHLLLWRYEWFRGLLKWTPNDFGEGECASYRVNNGGCSGREISPEGMLIAAGTPKDVECLKSWRSRHSFSSSQTDALFEVEEHGREGFIDRTGRIVIPLCFDAVGEFSEGLARFERDGRWGYINPTGNVVIEPTLPWAEEFHEGLAHVQVTGTVLGYDGRWGYVDQTGKIVIPPNSGRMISDSSGEESAFHDGLAMIEVEGKAIPPRKGFIDNDGRLVVPARFTYAYPFSEGLAAATESESGDTGWGYIDKSGIWVIPPRFDWASSFEFGLAPVNRKKNCGYIDKKGNEVLRLPAPGGQQDCAAAWGDFTDGLSRWLFGKKYGFIDRNGRTVIPPQFDLTYGFSEGLAAVQIDKKWGYIDTTEKMMIAPQEFWSVKPFHNGLAEVQTKDGSVGYINRSGKYVWGPHKRDDAATE
ncbi:MAG: WG repeat-containing protein [Candidatus Acidiferrales bacterium]